MAFARQGAEYPDGNDIDIQLYIKDLITGELINVSDCGPNVMFSVTTGEVFLMDAGQSIIFSSRTEIDPLHAGNFSAQVYMHKLWDLLKDQAITFTR